MTIKIMMKQLADADENYAKDLLELAKAENIDYNKLLKMSLDDFLIFASEILNAKLEVLGHCQKKQSPSIWK